MKDIVATNYDSERIIVEAGDEAENDGDDKQVDGDSDLLARGGEGRSFCEW